MISKLKIKLTKFLIHLVEVLSRNQTAAQHSERVNQIRFLLHEILPATSEKWAEKVIIEGGCFNYFELPSGKMPKYDFVLPEFPLYVVVCGIESADWETARARGISRDAWENAAHDLRFLEENTKYLPSAGKPTQPLVVIIRWNDPINHFSILDKINSYETLVST